MATRSFTIFQDVPSSPKTLTLKATTSVLSSMTTTNVDKVGTLPSLATEADKENLDPLTGERVNANSKGTAKKRKNNTSSSKALASIETKKLKEDQGSQLKKRKSSASSAVKKGRGGKRAPSSTRKTSKKLHAAPCLPSVEEESTENVVPEGSDIALALPLTRAEIDAKCYELTVKPLADVTQAFEQAPGAEEWFADVPEDDLESKLQFVKETSQEPELRDFFTPVHLGYASAGSSRSASTISSQEPKVFTTPDRKQIYHTFTFASPSPVCPAKITRSTSVPRLIISSPAKTES
ncbi:uncharacterized protein BT62DRAFT_918221 [Guyanagaster necrorhizus]|uniref:Uncharacterized protein n=1 Tax=Guyanagaster necrorhizus TaxID=856835 RepID=A0A9P7VYN0_9AGAR|nr:uncharacterized protein BT62DRAFT_918221 [Guyanagaster necrorhizus MCA 3950]KAG7448649.1 hypothetical protein BT62DRAFT_918221 [Guyanagaster necrorhizus MCA 3950]